MAFARLILALILAALVLSGLEGISSVFAHAGYKSSTPVKDEVVQDSPTQVDVFFAEEVFKQEGRNFVRVFDDGGTQVSEGDGAVDDADRTHITATLKADLAPGRYTVEWMTTSDEDNDVDDGTFCFYISVQPTAAQQAECAAFEEDGGQPTATSAPATPTASSEPTATTVPGDGDDDNGSSGGAIAAVVGVVIAVAVVGGGLLFWVRRSRA